MNLTQYLSWLGRVNKKALSEERALASAFLSSIKNVLAGFSTIAGAWLPGFTGPVPPPLSIRVCYSIGIMIAQLNKLVKTFAKNKELLLQSLKDLLNLLLFTVFGNANFIKIVAFAVDTNDSRKIFNFITANSFRP